MGRPGIHQKGRFQLLVHDLAVQQHAAVEHPVILCRDLLQFLHIIAGTVDMQLGIGDVRHAEALHQVAQAVLLADTAGIEHHPGLRLFLHGRDLFPHGDITVALQDNIGLAAFV